MFNGNKIRYLEESNPETESRKVDVRGWGKNEKLLFNEYKVAFGEDKKCSGHDGDSCTLYECT